MPPIRASPGLKPVKYERTHEENQERLVLIFLVMLPRRLTFPEHTLLPLVEAIVVLRHAWSPRGARQPSTKSAQVAL
jgi:hypothetical protein